MKLKSYKSLKSFLLNSFLLLPWSSAFAAPTYVEIVAPNSLASVEGNTGDPHPFLNFINTSRYQGVFGASQFSAISQGGGNVTGIVLRVNSPNGFSGSTLITNLQINLSTTQKSPDGLSTVFSENTGVDEKLVFGPRQLGITSGGGNGAPNSFEIPIFFNSTFYYNPSAGNLLMDVRNFSGESGFGFIDAQDTVGDSISRLYASSTLPNNGVNALSGTADSLGPVVEFVVMPVPEPSTWALLVLGGLGMGIACCRKKARH